MDISGIWLGCVAVISPSQFEKLFTERLEEAYVELGEQIINGSAVDWADYKARAGELRGMRKVERIIKEILEGA